MVGRQGVGGVEKWDDRSLDSTHLLNLFKNGISLKTSNVVIFNIIIFFSGILCFISAHHCWFWCVLQRPIQVEPMQTPMASHCPVTDSENKLSADSYPTLRGDRGNPLSSLHFETLRLHALV